jgi:hypothetical protein
MDLRLDELALAVGVAAGFEGIGSLALWRRSSTPLQWNQAFLSGLSIAAVLLFPLTLLARGAALRTITGVVILSAAVALPLTLWSILRSVRERWRRGVELDFAIVGLFGAIIGLATKFGWENLKNPYAWDGYQIWATKAFLLFTHGSLTHDFLVPGQYDRLLDYPPLLPLYHAVLSAIRGRFEWLALEPNYLIFFLSLLISSWSLARNWMGPRAAMFTTTVVAAMPTFLGFWSTGGYADMPQAALLIAAVAAATQRDPAPGRHPLAFLLSGVLMVKSEGSILVWILTGAIAIYVLLRMRNEAWTWLRRHALGVGWVIIAVAALRAYLAWIPSQDAMYADPSLAGFTKGPLVLLHCWKHLGDYTEWGLLWPCFAGAALIIWFRGELEQKFAAAGVMAALGAYTVVFYFTNWGDVQLHIDQAFPRLLVHLAPIATVLVIASVVPVMAPAGATLPAAEKRRTRRNKVSGGRGTRRPKRARGN